MLKATINGESVRVSNGTTILDAMRSIGLDVPTVCHDPRLKPYGGAACARCR